MEDKDLVKTAAADVANFVPTESYGFEDSRAEDIILPRVKVINALSPERLDGIATEGEILNSLTKEAVTGKLFIPVKQYYSNIWWNPDRDAEPRMLCRSIDGRIGTNADGTLACEQCLKYKFDNTKQGKAAQPQCTAYLNFLGFFADDPMPVVLSFAKTNYNEGRKMLTMAKSMGKNAWDFQFKLSGKKMTKERNVWYIIDPVVAGRTPQELTELAREYFKSYQLNSFKVDYEDASNIEMGTASDSQTEAEIGG